MEISVPRSPAELKSFFSQLDKVILDKVLAWARQCYKVVIEAVDEAIANLRDKRLAIEHKRAVWYQTCLGPVQVTRRQYRDKRGKYRYLLDELVGTGSYRHTTPGVRELVLEMVSMMPYRRSAEVLRKTSAIDLSHQTIWRLVAKTADAYLAKAEGEIKRLVAIGELPASKNKAVSRLFLEADGVMVALQREKRRKTEVKVGIAYEGWARVGQDRYRTVNKTAYAAIASEEAFWSGMSLKLQAKYDLSQIKETIIGGDGASWVKGGVGYFNGRFQLDRYHLNRELTAAFGNDKETKKKVWQACTSGRVVTGLRIMENVLQEARGEKAARIARAYHYLRENRTGLADYRLALGDAGKKLRRTGAMEGNVDKLVVRRMKNQGMSWSLEGIRRLLAVRSLVLEKELPGWLSREKASPPEVKLAKNKLKHIVNRLSMEQPDDWLQANIPALHGPHANRAWARVLKNLTEESYI